MEVFITKLPTLDQIIFVLDGMIPDINERKIVQAFYLSKSTVADESGHALQEYTFIKWPEFIEFIARLAWMKYRGGYQHEEWGLVRKTKPVLDILLSIVRE